MNQNTDVDQTAHADFEGVKAFVKSLKGSVGIASTSSIDQVIKVSENIIATYLDLSQKAIVNKQLNRKPLNDHQRAYYYDRVLRKVMDHVELLKELTQSNFQPRLDYSDLIQAIISGILTRFRETPTLIPLVSSEFKFIHFNYMNNFGAIGIPLAIWTSPAWNLSVLWHEVGGYAVAVARRSGHLEQWATELVTALKQAKGNEVLWNYYRERYQQSVLRSVPVQLKVTEKQCRVVTSDQIRRYFKLLSDDRQSSLPNVEADLKWQLAWLGEFFEDLFGVQALRGTMLEVLADIFMRRYELPDLGDRQHPPPVLRLQVILDFLYLLYNRDEASCRNIQELLDKLQKRYTDDLQALSFGPPKGSKSELKYTAEIIANLYYRRIGIFFKDIDPQEEKVAQIVATIRAILPVDLPKLPDILEQAQNDCKEIGAGTLIQEPQPVDDFWRYANIDVNDANLDIEALLKVRFTETDGTPGGGTPLPFPP